MYYIEQDNKIVLFDGNLETLQNSLSIMPQYAHLPIIETDRPIVDFQFADTEEYIAEQEAKEKARVGKLTCTKRVFALMLQEMGIDYVTVLLPLIESNPQAKLEWDLCVELERQNPLLDIMAGQLGVTPQKLDGLFKYANGEITIDEFRALLKPVEVEDESL